MAGLFLLVIAALVIICMVGTYARWRDPLHPLMFLGPMIIYIYVVRPGALLADGQLQAFLSNRQILFAQGLFALGIGLFCGGVLLGSRGGRGRLRFQATPVMRRRLFLLGCVLGMASIFAYWFSILASGGFFRVYGRAKGYYSAGSGWINEMVNLSIPAAALLLLAWGRQRRYRHYVVLALVFASPLLIHGLLGARRGPTFIILATLVLAWYLASGRPISLWAVMTRFGAIGLLVLFLMAHRQEIYLGSDVDVRLQAFWNRVIPDEDVTSANETVFMHGFVNGVNETKTHYWGLRYATTYLVRPIPRQLWPTKYESLGLGWMVHQSQYAGIPDAQWERVLGWVPPRGSAVGFVADWFLEFSWLGLLGCGAMGGFFGWLWRRASFRGGLWVLLYIEAAALSVYVPTQSVSAVFHRFLFMAVPTWLLWKHYIGRTGAPARGRRVLRDRLVMSDAVAAGSPMGRVEPR